MVTSPLARGGRAGIDNIMYNIGEVNGPRYEGMVDFEVKRQIAARKREETRQQEAKAIIKIREEVRKEIEAENIATAQAREEARKDIEAENRAAVQAREAETIRNEKSAKLIQQKVDRGVDEIMMLIKGKIQRDLNVERRTDTVKHAGRDQLRAEVQVEMEEAERERPRADKQKAAAQPVQRFPFSPRPSHSGDLFESPAPRTNPPRRSPLSEDGESLLRRPPNVPPNVPEPPNVYAETESERQMMMASSSSKIRRLWRLEQEERSRERKERKTLRAIWEELGYPFAETLAAGLAGAAYGYVPPMPPPPPSPPPFHQYDSPRPSRTSGSGFKSTYGQASSDSEPYYSESESGDETHTPRRYTQARRRTESRGRSLRRGINKSQHEMELFSPHEPPTQRGEEDVSAPNDDSMLLSETQLLLKAGSEPGETTAKAERDKREGTALEESTESDVNGMAEVHALLGDHIVTFIANIVAAVPLRLLFNVALMGISLRLGGVLGGLLSTGTKY
ncbi:hypothetical protein F4820DRAFT_79411 [Hypoxylon rubiginosum]|uniref:Uncharacterized protein n=1 Tax=Hypoxylon rubiginosum TaxID=110542 RepID=A0ACB9YPA5_9PEZI|nr:hypothetical protein F4820DRAFT_79411 [Hypoxylon rubiginosum]